MRCLGLSAVLYTKRSASTWVSGAGQPLVGGGMVAPAAAGEGAGVLLPDATTVPSSQQGVRESATGKQQTPRNNVVVPLPERAVDEHTARRDALHR